MRVELIPGLLLAFAIVVILMPPYIRLLQATGFTKQIRIEGPDTHQVKHGTPTMGGALVILVVLVKASRGVELDLLVDDLVAALEARPR